MFILAVCVRNMFFFLVRFHILVQLVSSLINNCKLLSVIEVLDY